MLNTILSRRSIRKYKPDPVPEQDVLDILRAAMSAPSTKNQQPWHFVVITDREVLNNITEFHPYAQMLKTAPCAILVVGRCRLQGCTNYQRAWPRSQRMRALGVPLSSRAAMSTALSGSRSWSVGIRIARLLPVLRQIDICFIRRGAWTTWWSSLRFS